jgi:hypothetical protein
VWDPLEFHDLRYRVLVPNERDDSLHLGAANGLIAEHFK